MMEKSKEEKGEKRQEGRKDGKQEDWENIFETGLQAEQSLGSFYSRHCRRCLVLGDS